MPSKYDLDKFYTKPEVAKELLKNVDLKSYKMIIEPSAGNGSFSNQIKGCIAFDINPEHENIKQMDFFDMVYFKNFSDIGRILVVGNPPFGRNCSLVLQFIKRAAKFSDTIAFVLPKSFKKQSMYGKVPLNFWKIFEIDLPKNSFTYENKEIDIPCVFIIYEKRDELREKEKKLTTDDFSFTTKDKASFSFRRVGVNAGNVSYETDKSEESHYFIFSKYPEKIFYRFKSFEWQHENTTGPRSIGKNEIIKKYNECYK